MEQKEDETPKCSRCGGPVVTYMYDVHEAPNRKGYHNRIYNKDKKLLRNCGKLFATKESAEANAHEYIDSLCVPD